MNSYQAYWTAYYKKRPEDYTQCCKQQHRQLYEKYKHMSFDELRTIVCKTYAYAYCFAIDIDKGFHHETYQAVLGTTYE